MCWAGVCSGEPRVFRCRDYGQYFWIYFCGVTALSGTELPHYSGFAITLTSTHQTR